MVMRTVVHEDARNAAELETRRRFAGQLLLEGRKIGEVMEIVGSWWKTVYAEKREIPDRPANADVAK